MLDILMLEALLVVDDLPTSNVIHFETEMVESRKLGSIQEPAWVQGRDIPEEDGGLCRKTSIPT